MTTFVRYKYNVGTYYNQIINFMKNFTKSMLVMCLAIVGFAMAACTPDSTNDGRNEVKTTYEVVAGQPSATMVDITVKTKGIKEFAYVQRDTEVPATAIMSAGKKIEIEDANVLSEHTVQIQGLEASSSYKVFFAFREAKTNKLMPVQCVEFTTEAYGDVITIIERRNDGFHLRVQMPDEVKQRGNALRYSTSSLPMYNYSKREGAMEIDMLLFNAGQYTTTDKTIRYDEYYNYERDENGNVIEEGAEFSDPKVPGEPGIFLIGEYAYMENPDERICIVDEDGDGEYELKSYYDEMTYLDRTIWAYPAGWNPGYYRPMYDFISWAKEIDTDAYDTEKYWNGYYQRMQINTLEPETTVGNVAIEVTDMTPIDACITFKADEDILLYNIIICTESEYQTQILPLIDNNEDYLRWFVGSYFAMNSFGTHSSMDPVSELHLNAEEWGNNGWFVDTKGMAGQEIRVLVAGIGDQEGKKQCFNSTTFTLPEVTLPKPEVIITPIENKNDPYSATFNIKNPNYGTNDVKQAYFACNYVREFDQILKSYSYSSLLKEMGNALHYDQTAIEQINSEAGFTFTVSSRENATTRLAMLVYNWEGSSNNPDATGSQAVAEVTTPPANYPTRVESTLFTTLCGEWEATAPMQTYVAATETEEAYWKSVGSYTSDVTIASGVEYPEYLTEEIYDLYAEWGISRDKTDALFAEFQKMAKDYNNRTRGFNRLLCLGYNFTDHEYNLGRVQTPYDLFVSDEFSVATVADMFYDFGPKWNLEIDADGNVWLPINIEREFPLSAFYYGIDYTFYMLAIGDSSYMGAPVYGNDGKLVLDSRFPVEVSADGNTITIKPIVYNYTDSYGQPAVETYYPCVAQLQYGQATPLNPRVAGDVVLKRKGASTQSVKANAAVAGGVSKSVNSLGEAPKAKQRAYSITPFTIDESKVIKKIVRETPYDNSEEAYHARVRALFKEIYGVDFPAKN